MRQVEQHAAWSGITGEDFGQQVSRPTANIDNGIEGRKIVSGGDRGRLLAMEADHRLIEEGCVLGMSSEIVKQWHSLGFLKTSLAGLNRIDQMIPRTLGPGATERQHGRSCRARCVSLKCRT